MKNIYFYSRKKDYFEFSNFSVHPITINGKEYKTNEHYFQSMKFIDENYREIIRLSKTPREAKRLGSSRKCEIQPDWDQKRIEVMEEAVKAKFTQHDDLKKLLLSTDNATLVEDAPYDYFWGCGKKRTGKNMLGQILMKIREEIK